VDDRVIRDQSAPPSDSLAEAVVLHAMLIKPERVGEHDLAPLLVLPEHRLCWRAMTMARMRVSTRDPASFAIHWLAALRELEPALWEPYARLVLCVEDDLSRRGWMEYDQADGERRRFDYTHDFGWWLARLERIAEARRGIEAAQQIAARYWQVPDEPYSAQEAHRMLERHLGPSGAGDIRIDL
jgi:hypothetical protein